MTDAQPLLALAVQHILAEKGMTQVELAAAIRAKPSDLSRRLSGEVPLEPRDIPRLALGLGITPESLRDRAARLGWQSTVAGTAARLGRPAPQGPPGREARLDGALPAPRYPQAS